MTDKMTETFDFETVWPRPTTGWAKWDGARAAGCPPEQLPFTVADMEFRTAPAVIDAVVETARQGFWGYTCVDDRFGAAVCGWAARRHGWQPDPAWLVATPGVVPAIYTAVRAFTRPGDGVLVQPPVYPPFYSAALKNDRVLVESPLVERNGEYAIDFDDLRAKAKRARLMVLCSPHNPVGRVWRRTELQQVADICAENEVVLFADEIHCDLTMPGSAFTSLGALGGPIAGQCLIGTSASKTFSLAGLSCSSILVPNAALRGRFEEQLGIDGIAMNSTFGVAATVAACEKGGPWLAGLLARVWENYEWMRGFLAESLPMLRLSPLEGTYLAWLDLRAWGLDASGLKALLEERARLYANPGGMFGTGGEGFARLNIACPAAPLQQAMRRLLAAARQQGLA